MGELYFIGRFLLLSGIFVLLNCISRVIVFAGDSMNSTYLYLPLTSPSFFSVVIANTFDIYILCLRIRQEKGVFGKLVCLIAQPSALLVGILWYLTRAQKYFFFNFYVNENAVAISENLLKSFEE